jgi:hypothetical protein
VGDGGLWVLRSGGEVSECARRWEVGEGGLAGATKETMNDVVYVARNSVDVSIQRFRLESENAKFMRNSMIYSKNYKGASKNA